jgi:DNA-binding NtrC family response regulator
MIAVGPCKQELGARSFGSGEKTFVKFALLHEVGAERNPFINSFMCRSELRRDLKLLVTDIRLAGQGSGIELAEFAQQQIPQLSIVVVSGDEEAETGGEAPRQ